MCIRDRFSAEIDLMGFDVTESTDESISKFLRKLLKACCQNNSEFLSHWKKYKVDHYLEFPLEWGLGSSSTLIHNICLLYTSDAADERSSVDLGGRRIIKKKNTLKYDLRQIKKKQ